MEAGLCRSWDEKQEVCEGRLKGSGVMIHEMALGWMGFHGVRTHSQAWVFMIGLGYSACALSYAILTSHYLQCEDGSALYERELHDL